MNYQRIYDQIVDRAQKEGRNKGEEIYYESHHIVPKCLGGTNKKENLILLTGREHFLVHWILVRIYPNNSKLAFAFWAMCNQKNKEQGERCTPSSRAYGEARKVFLVNQLAFYQTEEGRLSKVKMVSNIDFIARTANTDWKAIAANTDYKARTAKIDWEAKVRNTDYEAIAKKRMKPITQLRKDGTNIREWSSVKEAGETLGINRGDISACCRGKLKSAGNFIWKYRE